LGLTPELIDEPEERLTVRSQTALLDEAAKALKDDCIGFTLARDFDLREIGLLYYEGLALLGIDPTQRMSSGRNHIPSLPSAVLR
jgi:Arabinose-binding domain of AraC transcription regulator, N-term